MCRRQWTTRVGEELRHLLSAAVRPRLSDHTHLYCCIHYTILYCSIVGFRQTRAQFRPAPTAHNASTGPTTELDIPPSLLPSIPYVLQLGLTEPVNNRMGQFRFFEIFKQQPRVGALSWRALSRVPAFLSFGFAFHVPLQHFSLFQNLRSRFPGQCNFHSTVKNSWCIFHQKSRCEEKLNQIEGT